jgi:phosphoglycerate kinase
MAHLGRPKGEPDPASSLAPVAERLQELLGAPVRMAQDVVGESAAEAVRATEADRVVLLENVRWAPGETSKDDAERGAFADRLAAFGDLYVDDAFGAVHRKHASVYDIATRLPHAAGPLVASEVGVLQRLTQDPARPYAVVLGGSKVSDKLKVIEALLPKVDTLLVGGGMCFTFLAAQGHGVGASLLEADQLDACRAFLETGKVVLPLDVLAADRFAADADVQVVAAEAIPDDRMGLDIGPRSVAAFADALAGARTVFWNGPMGVFELAPFAEGTRGVAEAIASLSSGGTDGASTEGGAGRALTVVGGGDSAAAVRALGLEESRFTHISTGGGASLEYLEGKALPGLTVLED